MDLMQYGAYLTETINNDRVEINQSHFHDLLRSLLGNIEFNEEWYRDRYADVDRAIANGAFLSGFEHYVRVGYFENRLPRAIHVDEEWYLAAYADVQGAILRGNVESAQDHFDTYGYGEGRLPRQDWTLSSR